MVYPSQFVGDFQRAIKAALQKCINLQRGNRLKGRAPRRPKQRIPRHFFESLPAGLCYC
jgi:hypothetical protein